MSMAKAHGKRPQRVKLVAVMDAAGQVIGRERRADAEDRTQVLANRAADAKRFARRTARQERREDRAPWLLDNGSVGYMAATA